MALATAQVLASPRWDPVGVHAKAIFIELRMPLLNGPRRRSLAPSPIRWWFHSWSARPYLQSAKQSTEHLVARTFFSVPVCLSRTSHCALLFTFTRTCVAQALSDLCSSCLRATLKESSPSSRHVTPWSPQCVVHILFHATSVDTEFTASRQRNSAVGRTVWSSGRHHSIHTF